MEVSWRFCGGVAQVLWRLEREAIAELALYNLNYTVPPLCLIGLTDPEYLPVALPKLDAMFKTLLVFIDLAVFYRKNLK